MSLMLTVLDFAHFVHDIYKDEKSSVFEHWILHEADLSSKPVRWRKHDLLFSLLCILLLLVQEWPHVVYEIGDAEQHDLQASIALLLGLVVGVALAQSVCEGVQAMLVDLQFGFEGVVGLAHGCKRWPTGLGQVIHALIIE